MQRAYQKVAAERPNIKPVTVSPSGGGIFSRFMMPRGGQAITNPFTGNISYNPDEVANMTDQDREQMLAHELTHSQQAQTTPFWKTILGALSGDESVPQGAPPSMRDPYYWRPYEAEAFQSERDRATRLGMQNMRDPVSQMGDIILRRPQVRQANVAPGR